MHPRRSSRVLDYLLLAGGLLAGLAAAFALRTDWAKAPGGGWVWIPFLAAAGAAGWGLRRMDRWLPEAAPRANPAQTHSSAWRIIGLLCLGLCLGLTLWIVVRLWPDYSNWAGTAGPWLWALALMLAGGYLLAGLKPNLDEQPAEANAANPLRIPAWLEALLFVGIAALAVYLRLHRLDEIPSGIYVDETNGALDALHVLEGNGASPFATGWYGVPNGYIFYMAGLFKAFGASYLTLKAVSLIPAILTVWAVYPLGRLLFGSLGGLCAMFLLAVSRWHLSMSRWGWAELPPLLFQILATFFLLRGLRDKRASDFAIGGLLSGLMMYTYLSSRLALVTLAGFALVYLLMQKGGPFRAFKQYWQGLALFLLGFMAAFAPLAVTHITDPFTFNNRVDQISIFKDTADAGSLRPLFLNIRDHLRFFHQIGDMQGKHNLPGEPQTDPFTGLLFVIGLAYGLWNRRDWRYWLLWLWILFGLAGGIFSSNHESPQSFRTLTVMPAVVLLAGDVLSRLGRGTAGLLMDSGPVPLKKFGRLAGAFLVCALLAAAGIWETTIYFGKQASSIEYQAGFNLVENSAAREAVAAVDSGMPLYLSPRFYDFSPLRFLLYGIYREKWDQNTLDNRPYHLFRPEQDLPIASEGDDVLVLLDLYYQPLMDYFRHFYPDAAVELVRYRNEIPLYIRIQVPLKDLYAIQGLEAVYTPRSGSAETRRVYSIDENWDGRGYSVAEWSGQVRLPRSGEVDFTNRGGLEVTLDGQTWNEPRYLCSGLHSLQVKAGQAGQGQAYLGWQMPLGSEEIISPQAFFSLPSEEQGLTGYYYSNPDWQGEPICRRNTPFLLLAWPDQDPVAGSFSARFKGFLRIEKAGHYSLRINADDGVRLTLDGNILAEGLTPDRPNEIKVDVDLTAGDHPIQVDYFQMGGGSALEFYWRMPGEGETPVPPGALVPEMVQP